MNQREDGGSDNGGQPSPSRGGSLPAGPAGQFGFAPPGRLAPIASFGGFQGAAQPSDVGPSNSVNEELAAGNARAAQRDFAGARSHFLKAVQLNPRSAQAHSRAGYASWMLKNVDAALH
ncbi:MAG TPA: hypothetical protein VFW23_19375, partial [Tepidisphaeraceae bacterium]|nr:hypothetical protein [Tepidisphaeraceae bacterium]